MISPDERYDEDGLLGEPIIVNPKKVAPPSFFEKGQFDFAIFDNPNASLHEGFIEELDESSLFLKYQKELVAAITDTKLLVIDKGRRIGATWPWSFASVTKANKSRAEGGSNVFYMGLEMDMTKEFIEEAAKFAKAFHDVVVPLEEEVLKDGDKSITSYKIQFASGFKVQSLPSKASALRARQGWAIIDEAAFQADLKGILKAAMAFILRGGKIILISTHNGISSQFNKLINQIKAGTRRGKVITIPFMRAIEDGLYEQICKTSGVEPTPEGKEQFVKEAYEYYGDDASEELDAIPSKGGNTFLPWNLVAGCEHKDAGKEELYQGGICFFGRDISKNRHKSPMFVFEEIDGILWMRARRVLKNSAEKPLTFNWQNEVQDELMRNFRVIKGYLDETGMGAPEIEKAQDKYGDVIEGMIFNTSTRLMMANTLKERLEAGTIRFLENCEEFREDLTSFKVSDSGQLVEGDVHPDEFWAVAMACVAAKTDYQKFVYMAVNLAGAKARNLDEDRRLQKSNSARFGSYGRAML